MKRQNKTLALLLTLVSAFILLVSCGRTPERITEAEAMPIQRIIDGIENTDTAMYRSAFLPDYDLKLESEVAAWYTEDNRTDFNKLIKDKLIFALDAAEENHGEGVRMQFNVTSIKEITESELKKITDDYSDYNLYSYEIPECEKIMKVTGTLDIWGENGGTVSSESSYYVIKQGDEWYLHPMYYYMIFS